MQNTVEHCKKCNRIFEDDAHHHTLECYRVSDSDLCVDCVSVEMENANRNGECK